MCLRATGISNLSFISKILEKVVLKQTCKHLERYNLLDDHQSAYRKNHNTETALLKIMNDLLCNSDFGNISILVLLDLSAAFDTIDHQILLDRLNISFGLSDCVLNWFKSYLTNRTQCISVNNSLSVSAVISYGVPQGSILGPLLYTIYTTPLCKVIKNHSLNFHMYADDTQLYMSFPPSNFKESISVVEGCVKDISDWMIVNKLKLNEDKTEVLLCNPKHLEVVDFVNEISIGNDKVVFSKKVKNLGVYFDESLSMESCVYNFCK